MMNAAVSKCELVVCPLGDRFVADQLRDSLT